MDSLSADSSAIDSDSFIKRLHRCAELAGSVNMLAKLAGIPQSTIRPYFEGTDMPRTRLLKVAKAAGVSPEWLLTGTGAEQGKFEPPAPEDVRSFTAWLNRSFQLPHEVEVLARVAEIEPDRLRQIFSGAEPDFSELVGLRHVFMGYGRATGIYNQPLSTEQALILHLGIAERNVANVSRQNDLAKLTVGQLLNVYSYLANVVHALGSQDYECRIVYDTSMAPLLNEGDLVFVRHAEAFEGPGVYLLRLSDGNESFASVVKRDDTIVAYLQNMTFRQTSEFIFEKKKHQVLGMAAWVMRKMPNRMQNRASETLR